MDFIDKEPEQHFELIFPDRYMKLIETILRQNEDILKANCRMLNLLSAYPAVIPTTQRNTSNG